MGLSSFTIGTDVAEFHATIRGSRQEMGDLQRLTIAVVFDDHWGWQDLQALVTVKYGVQSPLGGTPIVDVVRGPGEGSLLIDQFGIVMAVLVGLERSTYLPYDRSMGTATFLVTDGTI